MEEVKKEEGKNAVFSIFDINDEEKKFIVPKEITHRQYFRIATMFKDLGVKAADVMEAPKIDVETSELDMNFKTGSTLSKLMLGGRLPEFFATILIPADKKVWKPDMVDANVIIMDDIGDVTATEVLTSFLTGRAELIVGLVQFFGNFVSENSELMNKFGLTQLSPSQPEA